MEGSKNGKEAEISEEELFQSYRSVHQRRYNDYEFVIF
jgi:hypothetical protein